MPAKGHQPSTDETRAGLAKRLRVSAVSIDAWAALPGAPTGFNYEEWKAFVKENDLGIAGNRVSKSREELLKESLRAKIKLDNLKIAKEERTVVDRAEVDKFLLHIATLQKTILYQRLGRELGPKGEGKNATELNIYGQAVADELADIFANGLEQWQSA